ncbi:uncharacterized protein HMPREF1541_02788 [Cyphellophora europaea CBS 101466]|uniref:Uncharacterized protein n=1 Tax=Cyphellophora europaea (strain CBS 101466) TaxID=1220924 RepID=W2S6R3_CYPE1|nr:uncharacterized protein HMPREF1541_02788 [Cyphellophora europaea CBS 101466]ETN43629.1 hypothetical protein HMPREF1541_02788 [Cyphellophora europaea CBS 101466]
MATQPFQKLCSIRGTSTVIAAAGSKLLGIDLASGKASWKLPRSSSSSTESHTNGEEPTSKRRKLDNSHAVADVTASISRGSSEDSINFKTERLKGERKKSKVEKEAPPPNVSHLFATHNGKHLIVVTAEDKAVSIYNVISTPLGTDLVLQSKRHMPKRLSAATLTPDERFLVVGDKFGDVYELPLLPTEGWVPPEKKTTDAKIFEPSATELTVHTKGNLQALKQQKQQKVMKKEREGLLFEHRVLLGHVSLLTDVALARIMVDGKERRFVLTSDRDEHVRVSRYPQAHVIEGFCLGIKEFVSRLCVVPWATQWVAVGTGEPSLRIYEWLSGKLLDMDDFQGVAELLEVLSPSSAQESEDRKLAVSGIWPVSVADVNATAGKACGQLLVALEGVPLLFCYSINAEGKITPSQKLEMDGNILDVAALEAPPNTSSIAVSIDTAHGAGSTASYMPDTATKRDPVTVFRLESHENGEKWVPSEQPPTMRTAVAQVGELPGIPEANSSGRLDRRKGPYSPLGEFLYGLENLRKKRGDAAQDPEEDDGDEGLGEGGAPPDV